MELKSPSILQGIHTDHEPARGSGQEFFVFKLAGRAGSGQKVFEISLVGSGRVGSGQVGKCSNITGRAGPL